MKSLTGVLGFAALLMVSGTALHAQSSAPAPTTPAPTTATTQIRRPHRAAADSAHREAFKAHAAAALTQRKALNAQVKAGTLTKAQAREQMVAWQKANKFPRKQKKP